MFPLHDSIQHSRIPIITWTLVVLNVLCFAITGLASQARLEAFVNEFGLVPYDFVHYFGVAQVGRAFSSMFMHAGLAHLLGNLWFLCVFGDGVEDRIGRGRYLCLYFISGLAAALFQVGFDPGLRLPLIGASGAISGVLGAYFILFPGATVSTFVFAGFFSRIVKIPAPFFLAFWLLIQMVSGISELMNRSLLNFSSIAFWAHIGGFICGMVLVKLVVCKESRGPHDFNGYIDMR